MDGWMQVMCCELKPRYLSGTEGAYFGTEGVCIYGYHGHVAWGFNLFWIKKGGDADDYDCG